MKFVLVFYVVSLLVGRAAFADAYTAKMYDLEVPDRLLFTSQRTEVETKNGDLISREVKISFTMPDGKPAMEETVKMEGDILKSYRMTQHQLGESGGVDVEAGKAKLFYIKADGKRSEDIEDYVPQLMVSATTIYYLKKNWEKIMAGEKVEIRFVAIDRTETFGFKFQKIKDIVREDGMAAVELELKPTSFIIAAIVKPIVFVMDAKKVRILESRGRILPKKKSGPGPTDWKDADVRAVYEYASEGPRVPEPKK